MLIRLGLMLGGLAATGTIALALALGGVAPATSDASVAQPPAAPTSTPAASPTPTIQVDTIYVPAPPSPETVIVQKTVPASGGEHQNEQESEGGAEGSDG